MLSDDLCKCSEDLMMCREGSSVADYQKHSLLNTISDLPNTSYSTTEYNSKIFKLCTISSPLPETANQVKLISDNFGIE